MRDLNAPYTVLGFDFGMKYIGIAVGQSVTRTASPLATVHAKDGIPEWAEIENIIVTWRPAVLVVGLPLNMDGSEHSLTRCARRFSNRLQTRFRLSVSLVDERLSTWDAKKRLAQRSKKNTLDRNDLNAVSATILLEQWFSENET